MIHSHTDEMLVSGDRCCGDGPLVVSEGALRECVLYDGDVFSKLRRFYMYAGDEPLRIAVTRVRVVGGRGGVGSILWMRAAAARAATSAMARCAARTVPDAGVGQLVPRDPVMVSRSLGARIAYQYHREAEISLVVRLLSPGSRFEETQVRSEDYADRVVYLGEVVVTYEWIVRVIGTEALTMDDTIPLIPLYDAHRVPIRTLVNTVPAFPSGVWRSDRMLRAPRARGSDVRPPRLRALSGPALPAGGPPTFANVGGSPFGPLARVAMLGFVRSRSEATVLRVRAVDAARSPRLRAGGFHPAELEGSDVGRLGSWRSDRMIDRVRTRWLDPYTGPRAPRGAVMEFSAYGIVPVFELGYNERRAIFHKRASIRMELRVEARNHLFENRAVYAEVDRFTRLSTVEFPAPITAWTVPNLRLGAQRRSPTLDLVRLRSMSEDGVVLGEHVAHRPFVIAADPQSVRSSLPRLACATYDEAGDVWLQFDARTAALSESILWVSIHVRGVFDPFGRARRGRTVLGRTEFGVVARATYGEGHLFRLSGARVPFRPTHGEEFVHEVIVADSPASTQQRHYAGVLPFKPWTHPLDTVLVHLRAPFAPAAARSVLRAEPEDFARYRQHVHAALVGEPARDEGAPYTVRWSLSHSLSMELAFDGTALRVAVRALSRASRRFVASGGARGRVAVFVTCSPFGAVTVEGYQFAQRRVLRFTEEEEEEPAEVPGGLTHTDFSVLELRIESKESVPVEYRLHEIVAPWTQGVRIRAIRVRTDVFARAPRARLSRPAHSRSARVRTRDEERPSFLAIARPVQCSMRRPPRLGSVRSEAKTRTSRTPSTRFLSAPSRRLTARAVDGVPSSRVVTTIRATARRNPYEARAQASDGAAPRFSAGTFSATAPLGGSAVRVELVAMLGLQFDSTGLQFLAGILVTISPFDGRPRRIGDPRGLIGPAMLVEERMMYVDHEVPLDESAYMERLNVFVDVYPSGPLRSSNMVSRIVCVWTETKGRGADRRAHIGLRAVQLSDRSAVAMSARTRRSLRPSRAGDAVRSDLLVRRAVTVRDVARAWGGAALRAWPLGYHFVARLRVASHAFRRIYFQLDPELIALLSGALLINLDGSWIALRAPRAHRNGETSFAYDGVYQPSSEPARVYQRVIWRGLDHAPTVSALAYDSTLRDVRVTSAPRAVLAMDHRLEGPSCVVRREPRPKVSSVRAFVSVFRANAHRGGITIFPYRSKVPLSYDVRYEELLEKRVLQIPNEFDSSVGRVGRAYFYRSRYDDRGLVRAPALTSEQRQELSTVPYDANAALPTYDDEVVRTGSRILVFLSGPHASDRMLSRCRTGTWATGGSEVTRVLRLEGQRRIRARVLSPRSSEARDAVRFRAGPVVGSGSGRIRALPVRREWVVSPHPRACVVPFERNAVDSRTIARTPARVRSAVLDEAVRCHASFFGEATRSIRILDGRPPALAPLRMRRERAAPLVRRVRACRAQSPFRLRYATPWSHGLTPKYGLYTSVYVDEDAVAAASGLLPIRTGLLSEGAVGGRYELSLFVDRETPRSDTVVLRVARAVQGTPSRHRVVHAPWGFGDDPFALAVARDDDPMYSNARFATESTPFGTELHAVVQGARLPLRFHPFGAITITLRSTEYKQFDLVEVPPPRALVRVTAHATTLSRRNAPPRAAAPRVRGGVSIRSGVLDPTVRALALSVAGARATVRTRAAIRRDASAEVRCAGVAATAYGFPLNGVFLIRFVPSATETPTRTLIADNGALRTESLEAFDPYAATEARFVARLREGGVRLRVIVEGAEFGLSDQVTYDDARPPALFSLEQLGRTSVSILEGTQRAQLPFALRRANMLVSHRDGTEVRSVAVRRGRPRTTRTNGVATCAVRGHSTHRTFDGRVTAHRARGAEGLCAVRAVAPHPRLPLAPPRAFSVASRTVVPRAVVRDWRWVSRIVGRIRIALRAREAAGFPLDRLFHLRFHTGVRRDLYELRQRGVHDTIPTSHGFFNHRGASVIAGALGPAITEALFEARLRGDGVVLRTCDRGAPPAKYLSADGDLVDRRSDASSAELVARGVVAQRNMVLDQNLYLVAPENVPYTLFSTLRDKRSLIVAKVGLAFEGDPPTRDHVHAVRVRAATYANRSSREKSMRVHASAAPSLRRVRIPRTLGEFAFGFPLRGAFSIRRLGTARGPDSGFVDAYANLAPDVRASLAGGGTRARRVGDQVTIESVEDARSLSIEARFRSELRTDVRGVRLWVFEEDAGRWWPLVHWNRADASGRYTEALHRAFRIEERDGALVSATDEVTYRLRTSSHRLTGRGYAVVLLTVGDVELGFVTERVLGGDECVRLRETGSGRYVAARGSSVALVHAPFVPVLHVHAPYQQDGVSGMSYDVLGSLSAPVAGNGLKFEGTGALRTPSMDVPSYDVGFEFTVKMVVSRYTAYAAGSHSGSSLFVWGGEDGSVFLRVGYGADNEVRMTTMGASTGTGWYWSAVGAESTVVAVFERTPLGARHTLFVNGVQTARVEIAAHLLSSVSPPSPSHMYVGAHYHADTGFQYTSGVFLKEALVCTGPGEHASSTGVVRAAVSPPSSQTSPTAIASTLVEASDGVAFDFTVLFVANRVRGAVTSSPWDSVFSWTTTSAANEANDAFLRFGQLGTHPINLQISTLGAVTDLSWLWPTSDQRRYLVAIRAKKPSSSSAPLRLTFSVYYDAYATEPIWYAERDVAAARLSPQWYASNTLYVGGHNASTFNAGIRIHTLQLYRDLSADTMTKVRELCLVWLKDTKISTLFEIDTSTGARLVRAWGASASTKYLCASASVGGLVLHDPTLLSERTELRVSPPDSYVAVPESAIVPKDMVRRVTVRTSARPRARLRVRGNVLRARGPRCRAHAPIGSALLSRLRANALLTDLVLRLDALAPPDGTSTSGNSRVVERSDAFTAPAFFTSRTIPSLRFATSDMYVFAVVTMPVRNQRAGVSYPIVLVDLESQTQSQLRLSAYAPEETAGFVSWDLELEVGTVSFSSTLSYREDYATIRGDYSGEDFAEAINSPVIFMIRLYRLFDTVYVRMRADALGGSYLIDRDFFTEHANVPDTAYSNLRAVLSPYYTLSGDQSPQLSELRVYFRKNASLESALYAELKEKWLKSVGDAVARIASIDRAVAVRAGAVRVVRRTTTSVTRARCERFGTRTSSSVRRVVAGDHASKHMVVSEKVYSSGSMVVHGGAALAVRVHTVPVTVSAVKLTDRTPYRVRTACVDASTYAGFTLFKPFTIDLGINIEPESRSRIAERILYNESTRRFVTSHGSASVFMAIFGSNGGVRLMLCGSDGGIPVLRGGMQVFNRGADKRVILSVNTNDASSFKRVGTDIARVDYNERNQYLVLRAQVNSGRIVFDYADANVRYREYIPSYSSLVKLRILEYGAVSLVKLRILEFGALDPSIRIHPGIRIDPTQYYSHHSDGVHTPVWIGHVNRDSFWLLTESNKYGIFRTDKLPSLVTNDPSPKTIVSDTLPIVRYSYTGTAATLYRLSITRSTCDQSYDHKDANGYAYKLHGSAIGDYANFVMVPKTDGSDYYNLKVIGVSDDNTHASSFNSLTESIDVYLSTHALHFTSTPAYIADVKFSPQNTLLMRQGTKHIVGWGAANISMYPTSIDGVDAVVFTEFDTGSQAINHGTFRYTSTQAVVPSTLSDLPNSIIQRGRIAIIGLPSSPGIVIVTDGGQYQHDPTSTLFQSIIDFSDQYWGAYSPQIGINIIQGNHAGMHAVFLIRAIKKEPFSGYPITSTTVTQHPNWTSTDENILRDDVFTEIGNNELMFVNARSGPKKYFAPDNAIANFNPGQKTNWLMPSSGSDLDSTYIQFTRHTSGDAYIYYGCVVEKRLYRIQPDHTNVEHNIAHRSFSPTFFVLSKVYVLFAN